MQEEKNLAPTRNQTPAIQPVAHHYADWAIPIPLVYGYGAETVPQSSPGKNLIWYVPRTHHYNEWAIPTQLFYECEAKTKWQSPDAPCTNKAFVLRSGNNFSFNYKNTVQHEFIPVGQTLTIIQIWHLYYGNATHNAASSRVLGEEFDPCCFTTSLFT
jgi:hypothetical protein